MVSTTVTDVRKLIEKIEKSQVPLDEEADLLAELKAKNSRGEQLNTNEMNLLEKLVEKAGKWERSVESSALTEPQDTFAG